MVLGATIFAGGAIASAEAQLPFSRFWTLTVFPSNARELWQNKQIATKQGSRLLHAEAWMRQKTKEAPPAMRPE